MPERGGLLLGRTRWSLLRHRSLQTDDPGGMKGYHLKMLFWHSEPDVEKFASKMPRKRTDQNLGEKASITLKGSSNVERRLEK